MLLDPLASRKALEGSDKYVSCTVLHICKQNRRAQSEREGRMIVRARSLENRFILVNLYLVVIVAGIGRGQGGAGGVLGNTVVNEQNVE